MVNHKDRDQPAIQYHPEVKEYGKKICRGYHANIEMPDFDANRYTKINTSKLYQVGQTNIR